MNGWKSSSAIFLGRPHWLSLQLRADDDDRTGRVVDALAEQVLAEPALLALDHVRQRLERTVRRAQHRTTASAVVEQCIDRLLEHPLLVADDDLGGVEVLQLLEPVVPVDDPAVQVVQVARGEVARLQQHQRTQIRRDDRDHVHDHPVRLVLAEPDRLDHLEALRQVLHPLLRAGRADLFTNRGRRDGEVEVVEQPLDRLGTHLGFEFAGVLVVVVAVLLFRQKLLLLERRLAGIGDDVVLEVDDLLDVARLHVQHRTQTRRQGLEEPDVDDRRRQVDVAHPLAADARVRDLHAATVTDDALVLRALVLAAGAFPVLLRAEDALAEEAVLFGAVRAVVDGLRLLDLAEAPRTDVVRGGQRDLDGAVIVDAVVNAFGECHECASFGELPRESGAAGESVSAVLCLPASNLKIRRRETTIR